MFKQMYLCFFLMDTEHLFWLCLLESVLFFTFTLGEKHCKQYSAILAALFFSVMFMLAHCGQWVDRLPKCSVYSSSRGLPSFSKSLHDSARLICFGLWSGVQSPLLSCVVGGVNNVVCGCSWCFLGCNVLSDGGIVGAVGFVD